jgi:hypothetical protein
MYLSKGASNPEEYISKEQTIDLVRRMAK